MVLLGVKYKNNDASLRVRADYMFDIKSGALLSLEDRHPSGGRAAAILDVK